MLDTEDLIAPYYILIAKWVKKSKVLYFMKFDELKLVMIFWIPWFSLGHSPLIGLKLTNADTCCRSLTEIDRTCFVRTNSCGNLNGTKSNVFCTVHSMPAICRTILCVPSLPRSRLKSFLTTFSLDSWAQSKSAIKIETSSETLLISH